MCDTSLIEEVLPHRAPFLFVDRVLELETDYKIVAEKTLTPEDHFFSGHFPGNPIMPGVLISEALAQTSGLLLGLTWKKQGRLLQQSLLIAALKIEKLKLESLLLVNINMKFSSSAKPGDCLCLEANLKKQYGKLFYFEVAASAKNIQIAKGTLALAKHE